MDRNFKIIKSKKNKKKMVSYIEKDPETKKWEVFNKKSLSKYFIDLEKIVLFLSEKNYVEAKNSLDKILNTIKGDFNVYNMWLYVCMVEDSQDRVKEILDEGLEIFYNILPEKFVKSNSYFGFGSLFTFEFYKFYISCGEMLLKENRISEAKQIGEFLANKSKGDLFGSKFLLIRCFLEEKDYESALKLLLKLDDRLRYVNLTKIICYFELGNTKKQYMN